MRLLLFLLALFLPSGLAVSYTVQVAALTDEQAARRLLSELREQGFPAYSVGLPTSSGQVYRLRVGVFANRAAAVRYAERMAEVTSFMPAPALAEDMPRDFVPFEPSLLRAFVFDPETTRAEILYWQEGLTVLRVQNALDTTLEAEYYLLEEEESQRVAAWQLSESEDGWVERVANFPLWPATYWDLDDDARREEKEARLAAVAHTLGLSPAALEGFVMVLPENDMPVLVLADRFHLRSREIRRYPAVGNPVAWQGEPEGPPLVWLDGEPPDGFPTTLPVPSVNLSRLLAGASEDALQTEGAVEGFEDVALEASDSEPADSEAAEPEDVAPEDVTPEDAESEDLEPEETEATAETDQEASPAEAEASADVPDETADDHREEKTLEGEEVELAGTEQTAEEAAQELPAKAWTAHADDGFTRLIVHEGERLRSWRALVGEPLWQQGRFLLAYSEGELLLYVLSPPP